MPKDPQTLAHKSVSLAPEEWVAVERLATTQQRSVSAIVRQAVQHYIAYMTGRRAS